MMKLKIKQKFTRGLLTKIKNKKINNWSVNPCKLEDNSRILHSQYKKYGKEWENIGK